MNILVTGVAGFIGSNLAEALVNDGHVVYGIDNFDSYYDRHVKERNIGELVESTGFRFYEADLRDRHALATVFGTAAEAGRSIDAVVHLAAKAGVRPSIEDPHGYVEVNVDGTVNLLEAMIASDVRDLLFASSSSVYGNTEEVPFREDAWVDHPISPYAATKKAGELLCHTYSHLHGMRIAALRFFTVYGPRQRPDLAIAKFTKLIEKGRPIPVYGDGYTRRDYTNLDDTLDG
ncbi:MAG: SDR family NAD(P)-dependent oxidoreductase, partial [Phycisphaeraceae bacterium]